MDNEYYERLSEMNPGDLADGLAMEAELDAIAQGFSKLPAPHIGGQGFDGPVRVGDAVNDDEAVSLGQLNAAIGEAVLLDITTYGNLNAAAWEALPSNTYLLFGLGSQFSNTPYTLVAGAAYFLHVRHVIGGAGVEIYHDQLSLASTDDEENADLRRLFVRTGSTFANANTGGWVGFALKVAPISALEALIPAADRLPYYTGAGSALLTTLTPFARDLLDDASLSDARKTLQLPTAGPLGRRNKIINGDMRIAQRGTSGTIPAGASAYSLDRWNVSSNNQPVNWSQQGGPTGANGNSLFINGAASTNVIARQRIESKDCIDLNGADVTLSFYLYGSNAGGVTITPSLNTPSSVDNYASATVIKTGTPIAVPGPTFTRYEVQFDALPSSTLNGLEVAFTSAGLNASAVFAIANVQLEVGGVSTPFEMRPYGEELHLCQRFYEQNYFYSSGYVGVSAGQILSAIKFSADKRITPTITFSGITYSGCNSISISGPKTNTTWVQVTGLVTSTAYAHGTFTANAEL